MSSEPHVTSILQLLQQQLVATRDRIQAIQARNNQPPLMQVPGTGKTISAAYEQLRNAAEYAEEHLLLQRAIRRFYNRNLSFFIQKEVGNIGEELVVELTQAAYLQNNTFSVHTAEAIRVMAARYMHTYWQLRNAHVSREEASDWVLDLLSVETEQLLNPHDYLQALAFTAYQHYLHILPKNALVKTAEDQESYEISLYVAVHQALLKSDLATVRYDMVSMYQQTPDNLTAFIQFNRNVSTLYLSRFTQRLQRFVSRYGAPMRILKALVENRPDLPELLMNRQAFLDAYDQQINVEYKAVKRRLNKGIIKSIAFIFITKIIIGIAVEIPYDLLIMGHIALVPLAINLLFPPLYMASLKLGLKVPSLANAHSLHDYIDKTLYHSESPVSHALKLPNKESSAFAKLLYTILFLIPFGITVYILMLLNFNIAQAIIFFVFMSTASFLGFRLSRMVRELELVTKQQSVFTTMRDFFYLPFILVGQWLSSKYAKVNAVAFILDMAIELPLKTILRLIRQWTRFLNEKHDEIY